MRAIGRTYAWVLGLAAIFASFTARAQDVVIIVNRNVTLSAISEAQLRDIFTGARSRLNDGTRVTPVLLKGGPAHEVFLRNHLGENPEEFRTRWRKAVFTGQGAMPREFSSEAALLNYVASTPGAIGYVSRASVAEGIRVLSISP
jgi:ABC-type phosphate transport system substrate-binding protein